MARLLLINNLSDHMEDADFIGIKLGDMNASLMNAADSVQNRFVSSSFEIQVQDRYVGVGEKIQIDLQVSEREAIQGLNLKLEHRGLPPRRLPPKRPLPRRPPPRRPLPRRPLPRRLPFRRGLLQAQKTRCPSSRPTSWESRSCPSQKKRPWSRPPLPIPP